MKQNTQTLHLRIATLALFVLSLTLLSGCKELSSPKSSTSKQNQILFSVKNETEKPIFVVAFSYIKKHLNLSWRWDKSKVYRLNPSEETIVEIDPIPSRSDLEETYGYLGVFEDEESAQDSTYQQLDDLKKVDLDLLYKLQGKQVKLKIKSYGAATPKIVFDLEKETQTEKALSKELPELDFVVKNSTGKTVYVAGYFYEQEQNETEASTWKFSKTDLYRVEPEQTVIIDVTTIKDSYDFNYTRGYLGVFDESEKEFARAATYQLLKPYQKIALNRLSRLRNRVVNVMVESYGSAREILEHEIEPLTRP